MGVDNEDHNDEEARVRSLETTADIEEESQELLKEQGHSLLLHGADGGESSVVEAK